MSQPRLYRQLSTLSHQELKRYVLFVQSPFHCVHEETQKLLNMLTAFHPEYAVSDEELYSAAFPDYPYNNAHLRILRTYLLGFLHDYWSFRKMSAEPGVRNQLLIDCLTERGLHTDAEKLISEEKERLAGAAPFDMDALLYAFRLELYDVNVSIRKLNRKNLVPFEEAMQALDRFSISQRLRLLCAMDNASRMLSMDRPATRIDEALALCERQGFHHEPSAGIYFHILHLLRGGDMNEHLPAARMLFRQSIPLMEDAERINISALLINYTIFRIKEGAQMEQTAFALYREIYEQGLMFGSEGFFARWFRNMLSAAVAAGEIAWARQALETAREKMEGKWSDWLFHYGHALLDFSTGSYVPAKMHLIRFEISDPVDKMLHDTLLLRIYYELRDWEAFYSHSASFRRFAQRNKNISEEYRLELITFNRLLSGMADLLSQSGKGTLKKIREQMTAAKGMVARPWMEAKLRELEKGE